MTQQMQAQSFPFEGVIQQERTFLADFRTQQLEPLAEIKSQDPRLESLYAGLLKAYNKALSSLNATQNYIPARMSAMKNDTDRLGLYERFAGEIYSDGLPSEILMMEIRKERHAALALLFADAKKQATPQALEYVEAFATQVMGAHLIASTPCEKEARSWFDIFLPLGGGVLVGWVARPWVRGRI